MFATAARRRRIIGDIAKLQDSTYKTIASDNVKQFRLENWSAILIQCTVRQMLSRLKLKLLRFQMKTRNAILIQSNWRMKFAINVKLKLREEYRLMMLTKLAINVQTLWRNKKERLHRIALFIAMELVREKRLKAASIAIQRVFRGSLGRSRVNKMFAVRRAHQLRRIKAVIVIQCCVRKWLASTTVSVKRFKAKLSTLIRRRVLKKWIRLRYKCNSSCLKIQCAFRGFLAKVRATNVRHRLEQMRLDKVSEPRPMSPSPVQPPCELSPPIRFTTIQVELKLSLLSQLAAEGAEAVVRWSVENFILHFSTHGGYSPGAVVQQVVTSVEEALHPRDELVESDTQVSSKHERVITVAQWNDGSPSDLPSHECLPARWSAACYGQTGAQVAVCLHANRLDVNVLIEELIVDSAVGEVPPPRVVSSEDGLIYDCLSRVPPPTPSPPTSLITIVLSSAQGDTDSLDVDLTSSAFLGSQRIVMATDSSVSSKLRSIDEAKFRFRNALVQVRTEPEPSPQTGPPPIEETTDLATDLLPVEDEPIVVAPVAVHYSHPTVVRVVLREPSPPPIDLDFMARRIQNMVRHRQELTHLAAVILQEFCWHFYLLNRWKRAVSGVLVRAHDKATRIQRVLRGRQATAVLTKLRRAFRLGHDFLLSEADNWTAFGLSPSECAFSPSSARRCVDFITSKRDHNLAQFDHILDVIQLPGPGAGCWVPSSGQVLSYRQHMTADDAGGIETNSASCVQNVAQSFLHSTFVDIADTDSAGDQLKQFMMRIQNRKSGEVTSTSRVGQSFGDVFMPLLFDQGSERRGDGRAVDTKVTGWVSLLGATVGEDVHQSMHSRLACKYG